MPVWRPAGSCSHGIRFPGHGTSKPHGQTVQELRTFGIPCMRSHTRSPRQADPYNNLFQRASTLRFGVSTEASTSICTPQVAVVRLSASPSVALHSGDRLLASSGGGAPRHIFRCAASAHATLHKLRRITRFNKQGRSADTLSSLCVNTLYSRRCDPIARCINKRRSPQTAYLLPLQRDVQIRFMRSILTGCRPEGPDLVFF